MPVSYPTYADYLAAYKPLFQGLSNDKMHIANLSLRTRIQEIYEASPHALKAHLAASLDDPLVEGTGLERPNPDAVYPLSTAGAAERAVAQDVTALADSFDAATRAMKQTIINFVALDVRDLLYIDESLTNQTVHGMISILDELFGEMPAAQQHALAASLRNPFNPRSESVGQFLSNLRHVRSTLIKVGQIFSDDVFSEYICTAIIAGAPEYAVSLDFYRNTSEARDLARLYRIINDKATSISAAQANTAQQADTVAASPTPPTPAANAVLPAQVTTNRSGRDNGGRGGRGRNNRGRGSRRGRGRVPDQQDIATLASQLQDHFRIQAQRYPVPRQTYHHHREPNNN